MLKDSKAPQGRDVINAPIYNDRNVALYVNGENNRTLPTLLCNLEPVVVVGVQSHPVNRGEKSKPKMVSLRKTQVRRSNMACNRSLTLSLCFYAALVLHCGFVNGSDERSDERKRAECLTWSNLENKTLPLQDKGHAKCATNDECTGFSCEGMYQGQNIRFGMRVIPCETPPGVEIFGYAPQYNAKNFSHVFYHKAEYEVPGALLNLSMLPQGGVIPDAGSLIKGRLEVHLKMNHDRDTLTLGLTAKACIDSTCISSKPIFNDTEIPVPDCPNAISAPADDAVKAYSGCLVSDISPCGINQVCEQTEAGSDAGTCACLRGYSLQDDMTCALASIADEEIQMSVDEVSRPKKSTKSRSHESPVFDASPDARDSDGGTVAAVIVSLLIVLALVGAGVCVVLRTRIGTRLRARMTNTPYGDMVIGDRGQIMGSTTTLETEAARRDVIA